MPAVMQRPLGATGIRVSILGLGAGHIGDPALSERQVEALLHGALDAGVTLIDTARSYGLSEDRIGRHLGVRRAGCILSTKVGYGIHGVGDWTGAAVTRGIDEALARLRTDYLDIVHLHSCPRAVLERGDVIDALLAAVVAGKVRVPGYSGDNGDLAFAVATGAFACVQTSVSLLDHWSADNVLHRARTSGIGIIAKRPLANAPWRFRELPTAADLAEYWRRWRASDLERLPIESPALAIRFAAFHPRVDVAIVGTSRLEHLRAHLAACDQGPLPAPWVADIQAACASSDAAWHGVI
jgi:aryl-alcohol dehydrogenase-like predicted oxidoreductase